MPLTAPPARGGAEHRGKRWTITTLSAGLLVICAFGATTARGWGGDAGDASARPVASAGRSASQAATVPRNAPSVSCPRGSVPGVVIDDVHVRPRLQGGLWLQPGPYRISVRGHLVNDTSAAIAVSGVRLTVGHRPWRAGTRVVRTMRADSSEAFRARGALLNQSRERMTLAARLSWGWRDAGVRACGRSGLSDDD